MNKSNLYPERIIPEETSGGPLASHLKRYDFAKSFCAGKTVLDAACGVGYGSYYLATVAKEVVGVDISENAIAYANEHYKCDHLTFNVMNVYRLGFPDRFFDVVCSFETIEHVDDPERFLSQVTRVLKEDGCLLVSTPHVKRTTHSPKNPYHKIEFSREDFESLLRKHFQKVHVLGQRRDQSEFHYYLQRVDVFKIRTRLPAFMIRGISHATKTTSWDEVSLKELIIDRERLHRATELIGVCHSPIK